jgi:hypothetical protein
MILRNSERELFAAGVPRHAMLHSLVAAPVKQKG